jgi:hypothetical protein
MKTTVALVLLASLFPWAHADEAASLAFTGQILNKAPYQLKFTPPALHHFNLEAPTGVGLANGDAKTAGTLKKDLQKITVDFAGISKFDKDCMVKASLYVCNDANTYCRPVKENFDCQTLALKK